MASNRNECAIVAVDMRTGDAADDQEELPGALCDALDHASVPGTSPSEHTFMPARSFCLLRTISLFKPLGADLESARGRESIVLCEEDYAAACADDGVLLEDVEGLPVTPLLLTGRWRSACHAAPRNTWLRGVQHPRAALRAQRFPRSCAQACDAQHIDTDNATLHKVIAGQPDDSITATNPIRR